DMNVLREQKGVGERYDVISISGSLRVEAIVNQRIFLTYRLTIIRNFSTRDKTGHGLNHECIILGHCSSYLSNNVANPSPPPLPSVARPRFFPVLFISVHNRVTRTAPDAP